MVLRVGRIPFLVCAPFFYRFFAAKENFSSFYFEDGVPSRVNALLFQGKIHVTPGSSINYAMHPDKFVLAPDFCTSCNLEVRSVKLFSHIPIEDLNGKCVHLTPQSATSVALLKILFALYLKVTPKYIENEPFDVSRHDILARLLIGDEALFEDEKFRTKTSVYAYAYDLGTLWQNWQHMPFVFGAFCISKTVLKDASLMKRLDLFFEEVKYSVESFRYNPHAALNIWNLHYPNAFTLDTLYRYYDVLDYAFTEERKQSLKTFFQLSKKIGLLQSAPDLEFYSKLRRY